MLKVKLNLEPTDRLIFTREVTIPTPEGASLVIAFDFRHRTRTEFAALMDAHVAKIKAIQAETRDPGAKLADDAIDAIKRDVEAIRDVAAGWNIEGYPFDAESLAKFINLYPAAPSAIVGDYRASINEGRLGN